MIELNISKDLIITTKNNSKVIINTPIVFLPFGLEKEYNNFYLKIQLRKTHDKDFNLKLSDFLNTIENIEEQIQEKTSKVLKSQVRMHSKYDPIIITKIPFYKGKPHVIIKDKDGYPFNIYKIQKGTFFKAKLQIDRLFEYKNSLTYKIKVIEINLV